MDKWYVDFIFPCYNWIERDENLKTTFYRAFRLIKYIFFVDVHDKPPQKFYHRKKYAELSSYRRIEKMTQQHLTFRDLMSRYRVSQATIFNWLKQGRLPQGMKIQRTRRWTLAEIESWEKSQEFRP